LFRKRSYIPLLLYAVATLVVFLDSEALFHPPDLLWSAICLVISLSGLVVRIMVTGTVPAGTSGRNTKGQLARTLNTRGIYSVVRHPLYLGNFLMWLGLILYVGHIWFWLVAILLYWIYYERIMFAEEDFLKKQFGDQFEEWAARTPAIIPRLGRWQRPDRGFSVKKVIKREYRGLVAVILTFVYLNLITNRALQQQWDINGHWLTGLIFAVALFITIRLIKKQTHLLDAKKKAGQ